MAVKLPRSRWFWYTLAALLLFVLAGYYSNWTTATLTGVNTWNSLDFSIPWIVRGSGGTYNDDDACTNTRYFCWFGKLILISKFKTPWPPESVYPYSSTK